MLIHTFLVFFLLPLLIVKSELITTPTQEFQCPAFCSGNNPLVDFGVLRCHTYEFEIAHRITSPAQKASQTGFLIRGKAVISGGTNCTYVFKLEDVEALEVTSDGTHVEKPSIVEVLQAKPVYFGYEEGKVTGFCPAVTEEPFAWNVKAAILSHLQADLKSLKLPSESIEEDISGKCLTRYDIVKMDEEGVRFIKRKPTGGCGAKFDLISRLNGVQDANPSASSKDNLVDGKQECQVSVLYRKPVSEVSCTETIVIEAPIVSRWKSTNNIEVTTSLKLISSESSGSLNFDGTESFVHTSLRHRESFDQFKPERRMTSKEVMEMLDDFSSEKRTPNARDFLMLVEYIRQSTAAELNALKKFSSNVIALSLLFDAAIHAQTETSVEFLEWSLEEFHTTIPINQMSFLPNPSLNFIRAVKQALSKSDHRTFTMVTSNLLKTYCKSHPQCETEETVKEIMRSLEESILSNCEYSGPEDMNKVMDSLRAISNLGRVSDKSSLYPALAGCLNSEPSRDLIIRVGAAEAFRDFPSDSEVDDILLSVIKDSAEDVEVRIQAYRSWARQLTQEKLSQLLFLEKEPNIQVKSFIFSHLREIRNSKDVAKQNESLLLTYIDSPLMKMIENYTRNPFQKSFYTESYISNGQFGGGMNAMIVYGPQSFLPRYFNLNFTLDFSRYSTNLFEIAYHSVYSKGITSYFSGIQNKLPFNAESSNEDKSDQSDLLGDRPRLSVRMFGRDIIYIDDIENLEQLTRLLETRPGFIDVNETLAFPTSGGIVIQINNLLIGHEDITYHHGANAKYGIDIVVNAAQFLKVGLNTYEGLLGYSTEDDIDINVPIVFTVDLMDRIRELTGFEVGLFGTDSAITAFKISRSVKTISPSGKTSVILSGGESQVLRNSPPILKTLIGLDASLSLVRDPSTSLITGYAVEVEQFEGLFVSFTKEKPDFSGLFQSVKFEVKRLAKSGSAASRELIKFTYINRKTDGKWFSQATLKTPWNSTCSCSANYNEDGDFTGELNIAGWEANLAGNFKQVGPSYYEVTAQLIRSDFSLSVNERAEIGKRYVLTAESTSALLPFVFESTTEFNESTQMKHTSELRLPTTRKTVLLETRLNWAPRNHVAFLNLQVNKETSKKAWMGEIVAINNLDVPFLPLNTPLYNYSLFTSTVEDESSNTWALGSSAVLVANDSSTWIIDTQNWFHVYDAAFTLGYQKLPGYVNGITYKFEGRVNKNQKLLLWTKGDLNFDALVLIDGHFNGSLHHPLVCSGEPGKLNMYLDNGRTIKSIEGFFLCGEKWVHKFKLGEDFNKLLVILHLDSADGYRLRIDSPYTMEIINDKIRIYVNSSVYIGEKYRYMVYTTSDLSSNEFLDHSYVKRVSDGEIVATTTFELSKLPKIRFEIGLPTIRDGFYLDSGFEFDRIGHSVIGARTLLAMDSIRRGFEFHFSSGSEEILPVIINATIHGLVTNTSAIMNMDIQSDPKGFDQMGIFIRTPMNDELKFKVTKSSEDEEEEKHKAGELSFLCSLHPGIPTSNFTGFLYKTQVSWTFDENIFQVEQQGEWNGNRATPPGMPFRYGIKRIYKPERGGGEIQVFAEDTNMGKAFGIEMLEGLYMYELEDTHKDDFRLDSNILLNWRKYLGRGVIGSQATMKAQLAEHGEEGTVELSWMLPDDEQTPISAEVVYKVDENALTIKSKASLGEEQVHKGSLEVEQKDDTWEVELQTNLYDFEVEFEYEGGFTSTPSIEMKIKAKKDGTKLLKAEIVAAEDKKPHVDIFFTPVSTVFGLEQVNLKISSQVVPQEMSVGNFALKGFFETEPILKNFRFKVRVGEDLRLIETSLRITDDSGLQHTGSGAFKLSEDGSELAITANLDSPELPNGPIEVSVMHDCSSDSDLDYTYDLRCSEPNNYTFNLRNTQTSGSTFDSLIAAFNHISVGVTSAEVIFDGKHALRLISTRYDSSSGDIKLTLQINNRTVGVIEGHGSLVSSYDGFKMDMNTKLTAGNSVIASMKLGLSNMPRLRTIDMELKSSTDTLGEHNFILRADAGYFLNLLLSTNENQEYVQLKTYLLQLDDHVVGLEFISSSASMVTFSLPSLPVPIVFRLAYDIEKDNGWRGLFQMNEPAQFDARTYIGPEDEIFLALSNKVNIMGSVNNLRLPNLVRGEKMSFIKGGCVRGLDDCISIVLGGDASKDSQPQLLVSLVFPQFGHVDSLVVESTFMGRAPKSLFVASKGREIGCDVQFDRKRNTIATEIAWNRQYGGLLKVTVGENFFALQNHERRVDFGKEGRTYYIRSENLQKGKVINYLECTLQGENQMKLDSCLLVEPITIVFDKVANPKTFKLLRESSSTPVAELSILEEPLNQLRSRTIITLNALERSVLIDTIRDRTLIKQTMNSTISVNGKKGEMYLERIPGKKIFLNFNNNVIFDISREKRPNAVVSNLVLYCREDAVKMEAKFRASIDPMDIFASVQTARAEGVLHGNASGLLNVVGMAQHNYNDGENIIDGELFTNFDEESEIYSLNSYWRAGALTELLFGGLESVTAARFPVFLSEIGENLISLASEELRGIKDIFNQTAIDDTWLSTMEYLKHLTASVSDSPVNGIVKLSNTTFEEKMETVHNEIITAIDKLTKYAEKLDPRNLYKAEIFTRSVQSLKSLTQKLARQINKLTRIFLWIYQRKLENFRTGAKDNLDVLKSVTSDAFNTIKNAYDELSQGITELKSLGDGVSTLVSEVAETASSVAKSGEETFGPLLNSLKTDFCTPLTLFDKVNRNSFALDPRKMTVNSTMFIPLWLRKTAEMS